VEAVELQADDEGQVALLFLAMDTQWRWTGEGIRTGLDVSALETVARLNGIELRADAAFMADLRAMERAAVKVFQEERLRVLRDARRGG
jgi:hypothetical protein